MNFRLLISLSGFYVWGELNERSDATTQSGRDICLQVRKLNFLNEMQLGDFPVSHTDNIAISFGLKKL